MKKPEALVGKIEHVSDGQRVYQKYRRNGTVVMYTICCDCQLVHLEEFKPLKGGIRFRAWRDEGKTKEQRSKKKK